MEIAKESTDESAGVLGDQRAQDRWAIVDRHEAMANRQFLERLMKSLGVFVAAPAGGTDAAGHEKRRGINDPLVGGGTGNAYRAAEDRRAVDLDIGVSDGGEGSKAFFEDWDGGLGFGESVPTMEASRVSSSACTVKMSFTGHSWEVTAAKTKTAHFICPSFWRGLGRL